MTKKELALKTVAELRQLAADYGHKLSARLKSGIVDELADVIQKTRKDLQKTAKKASKQTTKTVKAVKKAAKKASKQAAKTAKAVRKKAKQTSRETAKTFRAVKKAVAAGKKAAVTASKKQKAARPKKTGTNSPSKPSTKALSKSAVRELKKKDLAGMTVSRLKDVARSLDLKHSYATKEAFITALAKDLAKLRAEAKKKPVRPAAKKAAARKKSPAAKAKAEPAKPKAPRVKKPSAPKESRVAKAVKPAVRTLVEKAKDLAAQVREKVPAIRLAKPKVPKKAPRPVSVKADVPELSIPRVVSVRPVEESKGHPVELLAAIAVEPTELFVSWELDPDRKPEGELVLRVQKEGGGHFDVPVEGLSGSVYIGVRPGRQYHVDAGVIDANGVFWTIRRSNPVVTPPGDVQPRGKRGKGAEQELPESFYTFIPQDYGSR
jgi:hypothetical protein